MLTLLPGPWRSVRKIGGRWQSEWPVAFSESACSIGHAHVHAHKKVQKPCLKCRNVWMKGMPLLPGSQDITSFDSSSFELHDHDSMVGMMDVMVQAHDRLKRGEMAKKDFKELQQCIGLRPNDLGILADRALRPLVDFAACIRLDWMHIYLQHGCFNKELNAFLQSCQQLGTTNSLWRDLMRSDWQFPHFHKVHRSELAKVFSVYADVSGKHLSHTVSNTCIPTVKHRLSFLFLRLSAQSERTTCEHILRDLDQCWRTLPLTNQVEAGRI